MRSLIHFVFSVLMCCCAVYAEEINVSANVFANTLMLETTNRQGTGFTIDVDGRQYLITARHIVDGLGPEGIVKVGKFGKANELVFALYTMKIFRCAGTTDIAVLIPPTRLTFGTTMEFVDIFQIGRNAFFVGFPFNMHGMQKKNTESSYPFPLVKQGVISGVQYEGTDNVDSDLILLDGYNVFGFSGSPVTYWSPGTPGVDGAWNATAQLCDRGGFWFQTSVRRCACAEGDKTGRCHTGGSGAWPDRGTA